MGFTYQVPPVVGGTVLIIERIESQNYETSVSGWAIHADGSAEFFNVTVRGSLVTGVAPNQRIEINGSAYPNTIAFFSGDPDEVTPGLIEPSLGGNVGRVIFSSPEFIAGLHAQLNLESLDDGTTIIEGDADNIKFFAGGFFQVGADEIRLGDSTPNGDLIITSSAPDFHAIIRNEDEVWHGTGTTPLAGTWVDTAGARFGYYKDASGRVQVRGRVSGGGAGATIVTLPAGYRPTSNLEFTMRAGTVVSAVSVSTLGVLTVTANLATATASGIYLDGISFPIF